MQAAAGARRGDSQIQLIGASLFRDLTTTLRSDIPPRVLAEAGISTSSSSLSSLANRRSPASKSSFGAFSFSARATSEGAAGRIHATGFCGKLHVTGTVRRFRFATRRGAPDELRRPAAVLERLDPPPDQFGIWLADGEGTHISIIGHFAQSSRSLTACLSPPGPPARPPVPAGQPAC
jgi:hypothetical protein